MNPTICEAISSRRIIRFDYKDGLRIVEPFCHGISKAGNEVLRGYQTSGYSESGESVAWKLFRVSEMLNIVITDDHFGGTRADYNPKDSDMATVHCHV